ncbi:MAG: type II toxin-antitoxin system VapC family toxin [Acidobacteriaceae bacterium]
MILLDTHILIWILLAPDKLSARARKAIVAARKLGPLGLSAISLWEIAWLAENKRIEIDVSVDAFVKKCASYVQILAITREIAVCSVQLPKSYPNDPQDRIIGATAIVEGIRLLTHDKRIIKSGRVLPVVV